MGKTKSARETQDLAKALASKFFQPGAGQPLAGKTRNKKNALVLALTGNLGSGKTTFIQGFLRGLGIRGRITSPTFVLIKNYKFPLRAPARPKSGEGGDQPLAEKIKNFSCAYHIDCYRIKKSQELIGLGLKEILNNPQNIVLIEWAEKIKKILPKNTIWLKFEHGKKENQRTIRIFV